MKIVEIQPGEGGQDAELFSDDLNQAIHKWALRNGMTVEILDNLTGRTCLVGGRKEWV